MPVLARLTEEELAFLERKKTLAKKYREINNHRYQISLMTTLEKFLRRFKVWFLKMENLLSGWIKKIKDKSWEITQKSKHLMEQKKIKPAIPPQDLSPETDFDKETGKPKEETEEADDSPFRIKNAIELSDGQISLADLEKPIKEEQQWIDLIIKNPKNITAYKSLGLLYWKQHNYIDAKASLETAIKLGSKDKKVKEILEELKKI